MKPLDPTRLLASLLAGGLLCLATGCGGHSAANEDSPATPPVPRVQVVRPTRVTLSRAIEQPARIEAFEQTPIFAKISGYVRAVNVEIGSHVKKGDVLAELWVPEVEEQLRLKESLVAQARIEIDQAEKTLAVSRATVETARSVLNESTASRKRAMSAVERWKSMSEKMTRLARDKVVDTQSDEETADQYRAATAALEEASAKVASSQSAIREAEARRDKAATDVEAARNRLQVADADRRQMQATLAYSRIPAPFDGVVSQRHVDTGHFLQPGTSGSGHGEPLFVVVRMDKVRVFLEVPEADAVLVKDGVPGRIRVPVLNDREFAGKVAGSSWSLDPAQRTLRAEIDFDNPGGQLRPGMYAQAVIDVTEPGAMTVPAGAVLTRDGQTFCYRVEGNKAVRTPLRVGARQGAAVEVFKKQERASGAGEKPRWVNLTGAEELAGDPSALTDGQEVVVGSDTAAATQ